MQREIASLQNTLSQQQQQQSGSSKAKGTAARWEMGREGSWIPELPEERRGHGWVMWRDKVGRGGRVAVKGRCHSSDSCSVVIKILISTHTVCCLSRGVTSCELSPKREPSGDFSPLPSKLGKL